jgi:hypothetical protein
MRLGTELLEGRRDRPTIIKVVDTATDTVIRQIPSEEAIAIAKSIDKMQGLLINHKVELNLSLVRTAVAEHRVRMPLMAHDGFGYPSS